MLFVDILPWNFVCNFLTHRAAFQWNFGFFTNITFRDCKKRIFHPKSYIFTKNKNLSLEEQVLKELSISIDIFMFFSSFEVIVLILGGKVMTFVFYPLLRSQGIVKNWNTTE